MLWLLVLLPVLLGVTVFAITQTQAVTAADVDFQLGLETAVKAAAMRVTPDSQANGQPKIATNDAHSTFRRVLARNLGLDQDTLAPGPNAAVKAVPDYVLVIYNGDGTFAVGGAEAGYKYRFNNGTLSQTSFVAGGFPYYFAVTATDIIPNATSGVRQVTLDRPGVLAVMNIKVRRIIGRSELLVTRWAAAHLTS